MKDRKARCGKTARESYRSKSPKGSGRASGRDRFFVTADEAEDLILRGLYNEPEDFAREWTLPQTQAAPPNWAKGQKLGLRPNRLANPLRKSHSAWFKPCLNSSAVEAASYIHKRTRATPEFRVYTPRWHHRIGKKSQRKLP